MLRIQNLRLRLKTEAGWLHVLNDLSLTLAAGQSLGIVGESGCGKTQLALSILRLLPPQAQLAGEIIFQNQSLLQLSPAQMRAYRGARISMIFQDPMSSLNPYLSIERQMTEVLQYHRQLSRKQARIEAIRLLEQVQIAEAEKRLNHYPHQLSGGMKQRIMIAMALLCQPQLLIADEPTTALDVTVQAQIIGLLQSLHREQQSLILISHDLGIIAQLCHQVAVIYAGQLCEYASVAQLFVQPKHPYTQALLKALPRLDQDQLPSSIPGQPPDLHQQPLGCAFAPRCPVAQPICYQQLPPCHSSGNHQVYCHVAG